MESWIKEIPFHLIQYSTTPPLQFGYTFLDAGLLKCELENSIPSEVAAAPQAFRAVGRVLDQKAVVAVAFRLAWEVVPDAVSSAPFRS